MNYFLIEKASTQEAIAIVQAEDELQAFERVMSVLEVLDVLISDVDYFNIYPTTTDDGHHVPRFSDAYFGAGAAGQRHLLH